MKKIYKLFILIIVIFIIIHNPITSRFLTLIYAIIYDLEPRYFYNMIQAESSFNPFAYSSVGAVGLGQLMPSTAKGYLSSELKFLLWFPPLNLQISAKHLSKLLNKYNQNWSLALAAYNWGPGNVNKRIKDLEINQNTNYSKYFKDIYETNNYIHKILTPSKD